MKTEQLHIRIPTEEAEALRKLSERIGLSQTQLAAKLQEAAIRAAGKLDRLTLPIQLLVVRGEGEPTTAPPAIAPKQKKAGGGGGGGAKS